MLGGGNDTRIERGASRKGCNGRKGLGKAPLLVSFALVAALRDALSSSVFPPERRFVLFVANLDCRQDLQSLRQNRR
jgi:hypothetical protein